jgi:hypothetical protein
VKGGDPRRPEEVNDVPHAFSGPDTQRMECAAILDVLARQRRINAADHTCGRLLLVRVVQMLTKLDRRLTVRPA